MGMQIEYQGQGDALTDWTIWGNGYAHRSECDVIMHRLLESGHNVRLYAHNGLLLADLKASEHVPLAEVQRKRFEAWQRETNRTNLHSRPGT
jgi:hypothetical protein